VCPTFEASQEISGIDESRQTRNVSGYRAEADAPVGALLYRYDEPAAARSQ
jgi:hypothetical protein